MRWNIPSLRRQVRRALSGWWQCRIKRCSYYEHYLAYGPPVLTHEGFHAAERHCERAQKELLAWQEANMSNTKPEPRYLTEAARRWEERVRA